MKRIIFTLLIIFILALFLRFNNLSNIPVGFHIDEASLGYNAYSLLLTGKDDNNQPFPLYIDMFGDFRPSGYHYLTIIPVYFFGLTIFATRFTAAFFGSISIFAIYFLTYTMFKKKEIALLSALLLALAPWHIVLSRASGEAIVALFFILVGFGLVFFGIQEKKGWLIPVGSVVLSLSFFFYHTPRVFVPMLFFIYLTYFVWKYKPRLQIRQIKLLILSLFIIIVIAAGLVFAIKGGTGRYTQVNIFNFPETKLVMEEQIREDGHGSALISRIFHNKLVNYSLTFISNYFTYFDANFLFIKGGLPIWYLVPNMGLVYLIEILFILFGLFLLISSNSSSSKLPLIWLLAAPIVAALTVDDVPNINRAIVLFPMLEIIGAYGLFFFVNRFPHKKALAASAFIIVLFGMNIAYFHHQYNVHASVHRTWFRNNGQEKLVETLKKSYNDADNILVTKSTGGIYPVILFFLKYDPKEYQAAGSPKDEAYKGFGKFLFVPQDCPSLNRDQRFPTKGNIIYVDRGDCPENKSKLVKKQTTILREDNTKAFQLVYE
jgi:4-amino-4-deoxy-L-arabinose transferase-like glycosyltransferase